jgi:hypothetical protein
MSAQDRIAGGMDATYVPQDEAHARLREAARIKARGNLAAIACEWYGVDPRRPSGPGVQLAAQEFATLADVLGLDGDESRPGICRECRAKLPATTKGRPDLVEGRRRGLCYHCTTGLPVQRRYEPDKPTPAPAGNYRGGVGRCPHCDREYYLDGDGRLRSHPAWTVAAGGAHVRRRYDCPGSGEWLEDVPAAVKPHPTTAWGRSAVGAA